MEQVETWTKHLALATEQGRPDEISHCDASLTEADFFLEMVSDALRYRNPWA